PVSPSSFTASPVLPIWRCRSSPRSALPRSSACPSAADRRVPPTRPRQAEVAGELGPASALRPTASRRRARHDRARGDLGHARPPHRSAAGTGAPFAQPAVAGPVLRLCLLLPRHAAARPAVPVLLRRRAIPCRASGGWPVVAVQERACLRPLHLHPQH